MNVTLPAASVATTASPMLVSVVCNKSRLAVVRAIRSVQIHNQPVALRGGAPDIEGGEQEEQEQDRRPRWPTSGAFWTPAAAVRGCLPAGRCKLRCCTSSPIVRMSSMVCLPRLVSTTASAAWNPWVWRRPTVSFNSPSFSVISPLSVATRVRSAGSAATRSRSLSNSEGRAATAVL